ncbi:hypothetical protein HH308_02915 [Gordonia sp. TBRC 11910]|uniref:Uncharacterized protein n=1 Tax=Gordonia asplenii TaxID=2725283 RepID=A0A848KUJ9_9ACTN|nr:hypothetical protein [Gordonia asplenii]NMO00163.1 hypothetical protein [Gordonia asplenii]
MLALGVAAVGAMAQMVIAVVVFNTVDTTVTSDGRWIHVTDQYRTMSGWAVAVLTVIAVCFAVGYCALAVAVWRGLAWPRYAVSVLAVFSLFGLLGGPVILVMVIAGALAAVMLWLPSSMLFCTGIAMSKAPPPSNPFAPSGPPHPNRYQPNQYQPNQYQPDQYRPNHWPPDPRHPTQQANPWQR